MHIHYLTLEKLAASLNDRLKDAVLVEVFTQNKDEMVLGIGSPQDEFYLRVNCAPPLPFIWPVEKFGKAKKNVLLLLKELYNHRILEFRAVPWERQLVMTLESEQEIVFKMHGNQSNIIHLDRGNPAYIFRSGHGADLEFKMEAGSFDQKELHKGPGDRSLKEWLGKVSPVLDKNFLERISASVEKGIDPSEALDKLLAEAKDDTFYLRKEPNRLRFLLFQPARGEAHSIKVNGLRAALDLFLRSWFQFSAYSQILKQSQKQLAAHLKKVRGRYHSYEKNILTLLDSRDPEEIGHILMANMHAIPAGASQVELEDYYQGGTVKIKLKPQLNPQQNAEIWYRKQKNRKSSLDQLEKELEKVSAQRDLLEPLKAELDAFPSPEEIDLSESGFPTQLLRDLQAWEKENQGILKTGEGKSSGPKHNFHEFRREGFLILAGRNAKSNDRLTFEFANKEDLWLHAKDATGSHVIIRNDGRPVPKHILEYAASIAAGMSRRSGEGLVPVLYTPKKFVRKPRDGRPGQAIVDREEVVLIEPEDPTATKSS